MFLTNIHELSLLNILDCTKNFTYDDDDDDDDDQMRQVLFFL